MERDAPTKAQPALHERTPAELGRVRDALLAGLPFLEWRDSRGAQRIFTFEERRRLTVGRRSYNDVVLDDDEEVSRVHAELEPIAEDWAVADQGLSRNGTFVEEIRILGRRRLLDGEVLRFGKTRITYRRPVAGSTVGTSPASGLKLPGLTETQRAILVALARPYKPGGAYATPAGNSAVAEEVHLGLDAVKGHLGVLYKRFGIDHLPQNQKRVRLVECAIQWGLVSERNL